MILNRVKFINTLKWLLSPKKTIIKDKIEQNSIVLTFKDLITILAHFLVNFMIFWPKI